MPADLTTRQRLDDFPESRFACQVALRDRYEERMALGRRRMQAASVVVCGLSRNVRESLPSLSARIERLGGMFGDYRVVIYENDSLDGTLGYLWAWQQENPRIDVLSDIRDSRSWGQVRDPDRMAQMAVCRNRYLDHALASYADFEYFVVLDTDMPDGFSYDGISHTCGQDDWDAVGSNGVLFLPYGSFARTPMFFDAWAFRREGEEQAESFDEINRLEFRRGEPLVPVWSCFGGLAIYRMEAIRSGARYGGGDCEHVVLHRQLRERGFGRQFLNPSQFALYTPQWG